MWAMWANIFKNFVRGPSAAVTFGARPYPGAIDRKPKCHAAGGHAASAPVWPPASAAGRPAQPGGQRPCGQRSRAASAAGGHAASAPVWPSASGHAAMRR